MRILGTATVTTRNTLIAGNSNTNGEERDCYADTPGLASGGYNIIGYTGTGGVGTSKCTFTPATGDQIGSMDTAIIPLLGPLQNNGGTTNTHALLVGSPGVDDGNPAGCQEQNAETSVLSSLTTDQGSLDRTVDGAGDNTAVCDIGAYESAPCGHNVIEPWEECDDGNISTGDGCSDTCHTEICGNNTVDFGEQCDDGNTTTGDGCSAICFNEDSACPIVSDVSLNVNGSHVFGSTTTAPDNHTKSCGTDPGNDLVYTVTLPIEASLTVSLGHAGTNYDTVLSVRTNCIDPGTEVDCNDDFTGSASELTFVADAGTLYYLIVDGYDESGNFEMSLTSPAAICGNGVTEGGEECDNGASNDDFTPDTCRTTCENSRCGDGTVDTGEGCDNESANNDTTPDACRTNCQPPECGDGVQDTGEECDDANTEAGDGCNSTCQTETSSTPPPSSPPPSSPAPSDTGDSGGSDVTETGSDVGNGTEVDTAETDPEATDEEAANSESAPAGGCSRFVGVKERPDSRRR